MTKLSAFGVLLTTFTIFVLYSNAASLTKPNKGAVGSSNKASRNNSVIPAHIRAKRYSNSNNECTYEEEFPHRCRNDCHCARHRYCSSYGYCHERNRYRRQFDNDDGILESTLPIIQDDLPEDYAPESD